MLRALLISFAKGCLLAVFSFAWTLGLMFVADRFHAAGFFPYAIVSSGLAFAALEWHLWKRTAE